MFRHAAMLVVSHDQNRGRPHFGTPADGIVDITWTGCHTYNVESRVLKEFLHKHGGAPLMQIETDYSQGDVGQIKTRVEAFLEMLGKK